MVYGNRRSFLAGVVTTLTIGGCLRLQPPATDADSPTDNDRSEETSPAISIDAQEKIDPAATFLRTSPEDDAPAAQPLPLEEASIEPGDTVTLVRQGDFDNGVGETFTGMIGVFSGSETLLSSDQAHRIPDAIDAGPDIQTPPTHRGDLETDIPEDFAISPFTGDRRKISLPVPDGATHLFVAALDNSYHDNVDPDGDFYLGIA